MKYGIISKNKLTTTEGYLIDMTDIYANWENLELYSIRDGLQIANEDDFEISISNNYNTTATFDNYQLYKSYDNSTCTINDIFTYNTEVYNKDNLNYLHAKTLKVTDTVEYCHLTTIFETDSDIIEIRSGHNAKYMIFYDEGEGWKSLSNELIASEYNNQFIKISFSKSKNRKFIFATNASFGGVFIQKDKNISKILFPNNKGIIIGSSITERNWPLSYSDYIGFKLNSNILNYGVGATGYVATVTWTDGSIRYNYYDRIVKNIENIKDADFVVIEGGINDVSSDSAEIVNEQNKCIKYLEENAPNTTIIVIGVFGTANSNKQAKTINNLLRENTLKNNISFIDLLSGDSIAYDGTVLTNGSGAYISSEQISLYIESDGTHPNVLGSKYLGNRLAEEIYKILNY